MVMWDLERIYPFAETAQRKKRVQELAQKFLRHKGMLSENISPQQFLGIMEEEERLVNELSLLDVYAGLWLTENTVDQKRLAHHALIDQLSAEISNHLLFFSLWFKDLSDKKAAELIAGAEKYRHALELIRIAKPYTLSEKEERIITLKSLTGDNALVKLYDLLTGRFSYEWDGKQEPLERITKFYVSPDRELRKKAYTLHSAPALGLLIRSKIQRMLRARHRNIKNTF